VDLVRRSTRKSAFAPEQKRKGPLAFAPLIPGQSYPGSCPRHCPAPEPMGQPLSIGEAARVIGCSPWTIRQTLMPRGLPYFRCGGGKLIFYKNQIIRWIESRQKGTM
jgi:hypothetical protein